MASKFHFDRENIGKLILRVALGVFFVVKGINYFVNHTIFCEGMAKISIAIAAADLPASLPIWFAILSIACGMCLTIGLKNCISATILMIVMAFETTILYHMKHVIIDDVSYSGLITLTLFSYVLFGAGKYSIDKK